MSASFKPLGAATEAEEKTCKDCLFLGGGQRRATDGAFHGGPACRRHAPISGADQWNWPPVDPAKNWCGDFLPREQPR